LGILACSHRKLIPGEENPLQTTIEELEIQTDERVAAGA